MRLNGSDMFGKLFDKKNLLARLGQLSLNPPAKYTCSTDEQAPTVSPCSQPLRRGTEAASGWSGAVAMWLFVPIPQEIREAVTGFREHP
jgi:hypothetical protein